MSLTAKEISDVIEGVSPRRSDLWGTQSAWSNWDEMKEGSSATVPGVGLVELVDKRSASYDYEGVTYLVLKITTDGDFFYLRKEGWCSSYDGTIWDGDVKFVQPQSVTVTEWS